MKNKNHFQIADLLPIGLTLVVLGIGIAYGLNVIGDVRDDMCTYGAGATANTCLNSTGGTSYTGVDEYPAEYNASKDAITGVSKLPAKLPLIVTVIVAAVIIGILVRYLFVKYQ